MEKDRLVNFIATIMEDSGFRITKNYKIANQVIDIYGVLNTSVGEVNVIVACKNYEEPWKIGLDVLKDMENAARATNASKIIIFTTSSYTHSAAVYAQKRNIKLVDRKGLIKIAKNYAAKRTIVTEPTDEEDYDDYEYYEPVNTKPASLNPHRGSNRSSSHSLFKRNNNNNRNINYSRPSYSSRNRLSNVGSSVSHVSVNMGGVLDFFKNHTIVYMIVLLIIASAVSYLFNIMTMGPYTGIGKIGTSAVICFGGLLLVDRNLSDVLFKGFVLFFISLIIAIATLTI